MFNKCLLFAVVVVVAAKHGVDNKYGDIRSSLLLAEVIEAQRQRAAHSPKVTQQADPEPEVFFLFLHQVPP